MADETPRRAGRIARNTAIFSIATGLSRIAGLVREVVASSYFGTSGGFSAFTIAFQIPNLVRNLFADAALSAAFVPVFTELLEENRKKDAFQLASTFVALIIGALGILTLFFIVGAPLIMPIFTGGEFTDQLDDLTVGLSQVLFPIVLLLGLNGLLVGILNAYDHFTIPAISPLVWNVVIIVFLVIAHQKYEGDDQLYAYAVGVLVGTAVQLAMSIPVLRKVGFEFVQRPNFKDPRVKKVLTLMVPVTISLGLINFDLLINSTLGSMVSEEAPRAIDAAFRIYMLPQGMFSVAVATVLFPALARLAVRRDLDGLRALNASGMRLICLLLIPAAACTVVLSEPITQLVYQRGEFDADSTKDVSEALFWFSFSLPFAGANLLLTRTFFSLQRPWTPTAIGGASLAVNAAVSLALYKSMGIGGIVVGTAVASAFMTVGQMYYLRQMLEGSLEVSQTLFAVIGMVSAAVWLAITAWLSHEGLSSLFGESLPSQIISVGGGLGIGIAVYCASVLMLGIPEAQQIQRMVQARMKREPSPNL